jgi:hypothetical protein
MTLRTSDARQTCRSAQRDFGSGFSTGRVETASGEPLVTGRRRSANERTNLSVITFTGSGALSTESRNRLIMSVQDGNATTVARPQGAPSRFAQRMRALPNRVSTTP